MLDALIISALVEAEIARGLHQPRRNRVVGHGCLPWKELEQERTREPAAHQRCSSKTHLKAPYRNADHGRDTWQPAGSSRSDAMALARCAPALSGRRRSNR